MRRILLMLIGAFAAFSAAAHTQLSGTMPADGAALAAAPDEIVLEFSEPVTLTAVVVHAADGVENDIDALPTSKSARFAVAAPELVPGNYRVAWRALSEDTHVIKGEFAFTVEAGALD